MNYLSVKNWQQFQHYKDRSPPWIKLHRDLLRDYDFICLQDASKMHLMLIWLLASQLDNKIPYDEKFIRNQIGIDSKVNLNDLINKGFLIVDSGVLADCKQGAMLEAEAEAETETDSIRALTLAPQKDVEKNVKNKKSRITEDWKPSVELAKAIADKEGFTAEQVEDEAGRFVEYFTGPDAKNPRKIDWNRAFRNWCSQPYCASRVSGPARRGGGSQGAVIQTEAFEKAAIKRQIVGAGSYDPFAD